VKTTGSGQAQYRNQSGPCFVNYGATNPIVIHNPYHHSLIFNRVIANRQIIQDWIPMHDNGDSINGGNQDWKPEVISSRVLPPLSVAFLNQSAQVSGFSAEAYATTPAYSTASHAVFRLSQAAKITLKLLSPTLIEYPVYYRGTDGRYLPAVGVALGAGAHDLEFQALDYLQPSTPLLFVASALYRGKPEYLSGYCRVKIEMTDDRTGRQEFRWAYLRIVQ